MTAWLRVEPARAAVTARGPGMRGWRLRACAIALILAVTPWLSGCSNLSATGRPLRATTAADERRAAGVRLARRPAARSRSKGRLALTQRIRDYAVRELRLPDN